MADHAASTLSPSITTFVELLRTCGLEDEELACSCGPHAPLTLGLVVEWKRQQVAKKMLALAGIHNPDRRKMIVEALELARVEGRLQPDEHEVARVATADEVSEHMRWRPYAAAMEAAALEPVPSTSHRVTHDGRGGGLLAVEYCGGLGNRLFQYHAALFLARRWGKEYVFSPYLSRDEDHGAAEYITGFFVEAHRKVNALGGCRELNQLDGLRNTKPEWKKVLLDMRAPPGNVILRGYFQTFWGSHYPRVPPLPPTYERPQFEVGMHVRRGDLLSLEQHYVDLSDYYTSRLACFGAASYAVFSDDISWCEAHLRFPQGSKVRHIRGGSPADDLLSLSFASRGLILSNSTFGLWASCFAHLSRHEQQRPQHEEHEDTARDSPLTVYAPDKLLATHALHEKHVGPYLFPSWVETVHVPDALPPGPDG
jgi:hypothetical protein